jgi:type II secretory pathway pseudopilin PulG
MKKAFTLVEAIFTIVILGILSVGTFVSLKHLYIRSAKSKALSDLSFESQIIVDQISALLYKRVPSSVIGSSDSNGSDFKSIYNMDKSYPILEWIGTSSEALKAGYYSGFVDLDGSDKSTITIKTDKFNEQNITDVLASKFGSVNNVLNSTSIIFAGAFDNGVLSDVNSSFGWHKKNHDLVYTINSTTTNSLNLATTPNEIYEKFYLVDSAYAIVRKENITSTCSNVNLSDNNNTLYLFYNYRPWKNETYCDGNVTILSNDVSAFEAGMINDSIYFSIELEKEIRGNDSNVTISKQKVVF